MSTNDKDAPRKIVTPIPVNVEDYFTTLRFKLLRENPFFGSLVHRAELAISDQVPTAGTDGKHIYFNKGFMEGLTYKQQLCVFAHELFHNAFVHPARMKKFNDEDKFKANIAGDFLINAILKEMGFELIDGMLIDDRYTPDKYTMEQLMKEIKFEKLPKSNQGGMGNDVKPPPPGEGEQTEREIRESEQEMQGIIKQAVNHARKAGKGSGILERWVELFNKPQLDWKRILESFLTQRAKIDVSWTKPHRRGIPMDLYLPVRGGIKAGHFGIAIDVSGSISTESVRTFMTELQYIFKTVNPSKVTLLVFHDKIDGEYAFDEFPEDYSKMFKRSGGTDFVPVFKRFDELAEESDPIEAVVFFTDLCGPFPNKTPNYPVIFVSNYKDGKAPFGDVVYVDEFRKQG